MTFLGATILLVAVGLLLILLEILLPTHAILGAFGILCLLASVGICYRLNPTASLILLLSFAILTPFAWTLAVKIWPKTYFGKRILLPPALSASGNLDFQIGQTGAALSDLKPMGECLFNGKKIAARAQSGLIPAGAHVQIISADGRIALVQQI
jgi:membrane-bound ClpP family serine protease